MDSLLSILKSAEKLRKGEGSHCCHNNIMMKTEQIIDRLTYIFNNEQMARISVKIGEDEKPFITMDMHGLGIKEAKGLLDKLILINRYPFNLDLIHGYRHGVEMKKMLLSEYVNPRILKRRSYNENPGLTYMQIA